MIEKLSSQNPKVFAFKLSGKLHDEDYKQFVPLIDAAIAEHGKIRMLAQFENFEGWDLHALWDDFKFTAKHYTAFERIALIGDEDAKDDWMSAICKPFTAAEIRHFSNKDIQAARSWIEEGLESQQGSR